MSLIVGDSPLTFESYWFYKNTVELRFNDVEHIYYRVEENGQLTPQDGVTTIIKCYDKSEMLVPWGCKVMGEKLLANVPTYEMADGRVMVSRMPYDKFFALLMDAKSAHRDRLEEAANIGKDAHGWLEQFIKHEMGRIQILPPAPTEESALTCCKGSLGWMDAHNVRWLQTERKVYSLKYGYAGTMDGLCICDSCDDPFCCPTPFKDELGLVDWKSSNFLYPTYCLQTASYVHASHEEFPEARIRHRWIVKMAKDPDAPKLFETWHLYGFDQDRDFDAFLVCLDLTRSMKDIKLRISEVAALAKEHAKAEARADRKVEKLKKCNKADKYQGVRGGIPKCVDGEPCETCLAKYRSNHEHKIEL